MKSWHVKEIEISAVSLGSWMSFYWGWWWEDHGLQNEGVYTRPREKELRTDTKGTCLSNSAIIKEYYLLWLNYRFLRTSQTQSRWPGYSPSSAFAYHCLLSFGTLSRVVFLYRETFSFSFSHKLFHYLHLLCRSINMITAAMAKTSEIYTFPLHP